MDARHFTGVVALAVGVDAWRDRGHLAIAAADARGRLSGQRQPGFCRDRFPIPRDERSSMRADVSPYRRAADTRRAWRTAVRRLPRRDRRRDAGMQAVAAVREPAWPRAPVTAACAVEANHGLHVHVPLRVASRLWRRPRGRARLERKSLGLSARGRRETAAVQVRSERQADPSGRPGRDRLSGQGARDGGRCRGQCLDYRRERRHGDENQSRGQAASDDRRSADAGGIGTKPRDNGFSGSR